MGEAVGQSLTDEGETPTVVDLPHPPGSVDRLLPEEEESIGVNHNPRLPGFVAGSAAISGGTSSGA